MFQGNTHYKDTVGFVKDQKDNEFALFLEYVNMIDKTVPEKGKEGENFPHPKWLEFRRRVDQCIQDNEGNWNLHDVFIEAAQITNFSSAKRGKHYNNGFGFVTITNNQQDKSRSAHETTLTRENHDRLIKKLKNTVRGYPFCSKSAYDTDRHLRCYNQNLRKHMMKRFVREQEYNYRVKDVTRGEIESIW